ncbi:hypothetical protein JCM3765_007891 [Sporobolomyces pararoseus]
MISEISKLNLPHGSTIIEDADEEIFLLYTNKQQSSSGSTRSNTATTGAGGGLGINSQSGDVLNLSIVVENPWKQPRGGTEQKKGKKSSKGKEKESFEVEVELHQSIDSLRNRAGDTGSVLWRLSLHLAKFLLTNHYFPNPSFPPLLPNLSASKILELGSGTGFLGIALRSIFQNTNLPKPPSRATQTLCSSSSSTLPRASSFHWTFSDQLENLPLVLRNLKANSVLPSEVGEEAQHSYSILELDWIHESQEYLKESQSSNSGGGATSRIDRQFADLILAVDCLYNPSLSAPLAHTILRNSTNETVVVVVSELRESEALETFLKTWLEEGQEIFDGYDWKVARLNWNEVSGEDGEKYREKVVGELGDSGFVTWVGWCEFSSRRGAPPD